MDTSPVQAQSLPPVSLSIIPPQTQVAVGETIDVAVQIEAVENLYAFDLLLAFDPQSLEVLDMDPSLPDIQVSLGTFLEPGFVILNLTDNSLGRLRLAMTQLAPATPKSGSGTLLVLRFKSKQVGAPSPISILAATLASPQGEEIPVGAITSGQVEVVATLNAPTPSPIPSQAPGTPMPTPKPPTSTPADSDQTIPAAEDPTATRAFLEIPPTAEDTPLPPSATHTPTPVPASSTPLPEQTKVVSNLGKPPATRTATAAQPTLTLGTTALAGQTSQAGASGFTWPLIALAACLVGLASFWLFKRRTPPAGSGK